jgi:hypothetical protein
VKREYSSSPRKKEEGNINRRRKGLEWLEAQVVEHLPSKCKALNLNPSTAKKKKKKEKNHEYIRRQCYCQL